MGRSLGGWVETVETTDLAKSIPQKAHWEKFSFPSVERGRPVGNGKIIFRKISTHGNWIRLGMQCRGARLKCNVWWFNGPAGPTKFDGASCNGENCAFGGREAPPGKNKPQQDQDRSCRALRGQYPGIERDGRSS